MEKIDIDVHKVATQVCILTENGEFEEERIRMDRDALTGYSASGHERGSCSKRRPRASGSLAISSKRLSQGKFPHWPESRGDAQRELLAHELAVLLAGGDPERTHAAPQWRRVTPSMPA